MHPKEKKHWSQKQRNNFYSAREPEKHRAQNRMFFNAEISCDQQHANHDRINVPVKTAHHESNWTEREQNQRPHRRRSGFCPNAQEDQHREKIRDDRWQSEQKRKRSRDIMRRRRRQIGRQMIDQREQLARDRRMIEMWIQSVHVINPHRVNDLAETGVDRHIARAERRRRAVQL